MATRNRRERVLATLERLSAEAVPLALADNGSDDGTPEAVRREFPHVLVLELGQNRGGAARTAGVRGLGTDLTAFADDDSWWAPGALARAQELLARHPALALVAGTVLVGPDERLDPVSETMARSPLASPPGLPGRSVLGFLACSAVVRSSAYLEVGGFEGRLGIGGEEELLALELAAAGHDLIYAPEVVVHHHPAGGGRAALRAAAAGLPWVLRDRRVIPAPLEAAVARVEAAP